MFLPYAMFYDLLGACCSLLSTYYFIKLDHKAWPISLFAICINGWLYWTKGIYAEMMLEAVYFLSINYGWYQWRNSAKNPHHQPKLLNQLSLKQWAGLLVILSCTFLLIYMLLLKFTHSSVAFLDALTTSLSLVAQWLMCHKIIATWILWFITDALYAVMYLNKNLPFHCGLMIIYTGLAISGYLAWARYSKPQTSTKLRAEIA